MKTIQHIQEILQKTFEPTFLEVTDDALEHKGHANEGKGHFTVKIEADLLNQLSRVEAHRKIYHALSSLIPDKIHALRIHLGEKLC